MQSKSEASGKSSTRCVGGPGPLSLSWNPIPSLFLVGCLSLVAAESASDSLSQSASPLHCLFLLEAFCGLAPLVASLALSPPCVSPSVFVFVSVFVSVCLCLSCLPLRLSLVSPFVCAGLRLSPSVPLSASVGLSVRLQSLLSAVSACCA